MKTLTIRSPALDNKGFISPDYTCDGVNINPPLHIEGIPSETQSLVLIVDDPDSPHGVWDHWIVWNIPAIGLIKEYTSPGTEGINSFGKNSYGGPCPSSGTHRYFFKIYALDKKLELAPRSKKKDVEYAMSGHILAKGELVGLYSKK